MSGTARSPEPLAMEARSSHCHKLEAVSLFVVEVSAVKLKLPFVESCAEPCCSENALHPETTSCHSVFARYKQSTSGRLSSTSAGYKGINGVKSEGRVGDLHPDVTDVSTDMPIVTRLTCPDTTSHPSRCRRARPLMSVPKSRSRPRGGCHNTFAICRMHSSSWESLRKTTCRTHT